MIPIKDLNVFVKTKQDLFDCLNGFEFEHPMQVVIGPIQKKRSLSQNAVFHMWCGELSQFLTGKGRAFATPEWCKDAMKYTFLGFEAVGHTNVTTGEIMAYSELKHTSNLSTGEMFHFMEQVESWCAGIGCLLTIPEKSEYMTIKKQVNQ